MYPPRHTSDNWEPGDRDESPTRSKTKKKKLHWQSWNCSLLHYAPKHAPDIQGCVPETFRIPIPYGSSNVPFYHSKDHYNSPYPCTTNRQNNTRDNENRVNTPSVPSIWISFGLFKSVPPPPLSRKGSFSNETNKGRSGFFVFFP